MNTKQKYNWSLLKQEFYASDFLEVKAFFQSKYKTYTGHIKAKTSGWTSDKKYFIKSIVNESIELTKQKQILEMSETLDELLSEIYHRINCKEIRERLTIKDLHILWNIVMTMNDKPTKVNPPIDFGLPKRDNPDELTLEEKQAIERATNFILPSYRNEKV